MDALLLLVAFIAIVALLGTASTTLGTDSRDGFA